MYSLEVKGLKCRSDHTKDVFTDMEKRLMDTSQMMGLTAQSARLNL